MPLFMISVHHPEITEPPPPEVTERAHREVGLFNDELIASGVFVFGGGLAPASTAKVVRPADTGTTTSDGPFDPTDDLGGFWMIEVADLASALGWAEKGSTACGEAVQVREFGDHS